MRYTSSGEELTGKQMTCQWYEEASDYNYDQDFQPGKGHFAQIVWKTTREVGFGRAQSKDGKWYAGKSKKSRILKLDIKIFIFVL
jgi:hypothetical protein